jgi:hypothetical protein
MIPVTTSENFIYGISDTLFFGGPIGEAFSRAMALAATCEADLQRLLRLFHVPNAFGARNRISVIIDPAIAPAAAGVNFGYSEGGQSRILIVPTYAAGLVPDAAARGGFVHEMAEILMDYRMQKMSGKWVANYSTGESLADICSAELHPEGQGGPWSSAWLNMTEVSFPHITPRPNWVDKTDPTDGNTFSYGCGVLFLNYLIYQRGIALDEIIADGGATLAETYRNLTGRDDGWASFIQLINTYFPFGPAYTPKTDKLFPLPQLASLTISPDTVVAGDAATARVSLNGPHPGFDLKADLSCNIPQFASLPIPSVVFIPQNKAFADFPITTPKMTVPFAPIKVSVYAASGGVTVEGTLTVKSAAEAGILKSITVTPAVVTGGQTANGAVTLEAPIAHDTVVGLAAVETGGLFPRPGDQSSVATVKGSVTVPAHSTTAHFTVETTDVPPHVTRTVTILAHAVVTKSVQLKVEGA